MKILSTMRAGRVIRQSLYSPRDANPQKRHRAVSISKEDKKRANLKTSYEKLLMLVCANFEPGDWWVNPDLYGCVPPGEPGGIPEVLAQIHALVPEIP